MPDASPLASAKNSRSAGLGCLVPFGLLFGGIGCVAFWFITLRPVLRVAACAGWTPTTCLILESKLDSKSDSDGTTYRVAVRYAYVWPPQSPAVEAGSDPELDALKALRADKARHQSERYDFSEGYTNIGVKRMRAAVRENRVGQTRVCYVDPDNPSEAVLSRRVPTSVWFGAFTLLFPLFGVGIIIAGIRQAVKNRAEARSPLGGAAPSAPALRNRPRTPASAHLDASTPVAPGEVELKPAAGRMASFIVLAFFAAFWNGIVSVFLVVAVKDFGRGFIGWFLPIFLIPFVLVGLLLLAAAFQAFYRIFAPSVTVRLDPSRLRLGARVPFSWRLGGRGVRRLSIRLLAREEASYQQGTSTTTDGADFFRAVVFESSEPLALAEGRGELVLPAEAVAPAFAGRNNKLIWELAFDGDIPWRADVNDRFSLAVRGPERPVAPDLPPAPRAVEGGGVTLWTAERFAPGELLVFTVSRGAAAAPGPLAVQLGWFTEGRGTRDAAVVWSMPLPDLAPGADRAFEVRLPEAPWSFSGKLVSVAWRLEVLDAKRRPLAAAPLIVAPHGAVVALSSLEKEKAAFRWKRFSPFTPSQ